MTKRLDEVDDNVHEFFSKYGNEGFLQLFLTNYFYELIQYFLHSKMKGDDLSLIYYIPDEQRINSPEVTRKFEQKLKKECSNSAKKVVEELKKANLIKQIERDPLEHPKIAKIIAEEFEIIVSRLGGREKY